MVEDRSRSRHAARGSVLRLGGRGGCTLEYWFTRQRNKWGHPPFAQDFFGEGLAEYLGAVKVDFDIVR